MPRRPPPRDARGRFVRVTPDTIVDEAPPPLPVVARWRRLTDVSPVAVIYVVAGLFTVAVGVALAHVL